MPTVKRNGPYSFLFFSSDKDEPSHIHVRRDKNLCKYWLQPVALAKNRGFAPSEINDIERLVNKHQQELIEAWNDFFGT